VCRGVLGVSRRTKRGPLQRAHYVRAPAEMPSPECRPLVGASAAVAPWCHGYDRVAAERARMPGSNLLSSQRTKFPEWSRYVVAEAGERRPSSRASLTAPKYWPYQALMRRRSSALGGGVGSIRASRSERLTDICQSY